MAQFLGLYQLENLHRAQTKFVLVAITDDTPTAENAIPSHALLKPDLVLAASEASAKIQSHRTDQNYPAWWPIVLISKAGADEVAVLIALEESGLINVFSYRGGWQALVAGT